MLERPEAAAPYLLGAVIETVIKGERVAIRLNELEAYGGADDPASHAFRSKTRRNSPMFEDAGCIYVYRSYGIHWCANIVTGPPETPSAVLLRGGEVIAGVGIVKERRGRDDHLADGPGKLCQALAIDGSMSGTRLGNGPIRVELASSTPTRFDVSPRVGISKAVDRPWRFQERVI